MKIQHPVNIFWFRRDLRLNDNAGLYHALKSGTRVLPVFIFDRNILDKLENKSDRRLVFIHRELQSLQERLNQFGSSLITKYGSPLNVWKDVVAEYNIKAVYTNHDYEPYAKERDNEINKFLRSKGIAFHSYKDQVIFEKEEILKDDRMPYTIFTPYSRKWKSAVNPFYIKSYPTEKYFSGFLKHPHKLIISLEEMGFKNWDAIFPEKKIIKPCIKNYKNTRDIPSIEGTTRLSAHLRFGTLSIRELVSTAMKESETWLNELIWREFYMMILWHFPYVAESAFKKKYDNIKWRNNEKEFKAWCDGMTGYPIVDAGMRELNATGFMHNRVRMITASFLTKHLLIDWRWGEAYFAEKLLDYELSSNNGGWQWAAGTGCDAAPYFRIFNPSEQTKKFDSEFRYIKKWVPEFEDFSYPRPIVEHALARERCLRVYKEVL